MDLGLAAALIERLVAQLELVESSIGENQKQKYWADIQDAKAFIIEAKTADQRAQAASVARSLLDHV